MNTEIKKSFVEELREKSARARKELETAFINETYELIVERLSMEADQGHYKMNHRSRCIPHALQHNDIAVKMGQELRMRLLNLGFQRVEFSMLSNNSFPYQLSITVDCSKQ